VETSTYLCGMLGRQISAVAWAQARLRLQSLCRRVARSLETYDVILCPTLAQPPLRLGALAPVGVERALHGLIAKFGLSGLLRLPGVVDKTVSQNFSFIPFTPLANVAGLPSMNVPLDWNADGLPIGSMLTGRFGDEATLFRLAAQLETAHPWAQRRPPVFAGA
jgi:amidase